MAESTFTFRVEDDLKSAFGEAAKAQDRTGAQLLRGFMRDYVERQNEQAERDAWFRRQVAEGVMSANEGRLVPGEDVEAVFAERRSDLLRKLGG